MSAIDLLHENGANIIVSANRGKKTAFFSRKFSSIAKANSYANRMGAGGFNVYVKHADHDGSMVDAKNPTASPTNFAGSRTFFIDIDAGPRKSAQYPTLRAAANAFKDTLAKLKASMGLPLPNLILQTGGGLHIAWVLDTIIPAEEWKRLTGLFNLLLRENGLNLDTGATHIDLGVRLCGPNFSNHNHPDQGPLPTSILREMPQRIDAAYWRKMFAPFALRAVPAPTDNASKLAPAPRDEFAASSGGFQLDIDYIADKCETIKHALATGGAEHHEPTWMILMRLVARNGDEAMGRAYAHEISKGHESYTEAETDAKFDRFRANGKGYPTCDEIAKAQGTQCTTCPFYKTINSPAGIQGKARAVAQTSQWVGQALAADKDGLPFPYYNSPQGVFRASNTENEPDVKVWRNVEITNVEVTEDRHGQNIQGDRYLVFDYRLVMNNNREAESRKIVFPVKMMNEPSERSKVFSTFNVVINDLDKKPVGSMMQSWLEQLQARGSISPQYTRLGWDNSNELFVLGNHIYKPDGSVLATPGQNAGQQSFNVAGSDATYNGVVSQIMQGETRPEAHAMIAASFAAPFVKLLGSTSMSLNFYSVGSGYGKTTLSNVAASVWGRPQSSTAAVDDTQNALIERVSQLNNLPMFFDELRITRPDEYLPQVLFRLTHGVSKRRLGSDSKAQDIADWRTLLVFSTNFSFAGLVGGKASQGDAAAARYLDFVMPPLPDGSVNRAMYIMQEREKLNHTYGHAGREFIKLLVRNRAKYVALVTTLGDRLMKLASLDKNDVSGRNHAVAGAAMIVAAMIVERKGIFPINHLFVKRAIETAILSGKGGRKEAQQTVVPSDILTRYIKEKEAHRIVTSAGVRRQRNVDAAVPPRLPILYEIDRSDKVIIMQIAPLAAWLAEQRFNVSATMGELLAVHKKEERPIGRGTAYVSPKLDVMIVQATGIYEPLVDQNPLT